MNHPPDTSQAPLPPLLWVSRAVLMLVAFGGLWLSVRGQHPVKVAALVAAYAFMAPLYHSGGSHPVWGPADAWLIMGIR
jgi:hypothetical protein